MPTVKCFDKYGKEIDHLTQWDINVCLKIYDFEYEIAPVCHFAARYGKTSKTVTSTLENGTVSVNVPNSMLMDSKDITMFVFLYDLEEDTGRTIYEVSIPVRPKPKPDDFEYSDNIEMIQITALKVRLEALVAQAEEAVNIKIGSLESSYTNAINTIKESIAEDSETLNQKILDANSNLRNQIEESRNNLTIEIREAKSSLSSEIETALNTLIAGIQDGSPKGIFASVSELRGKPAGIYLYINEESENNGYIYYWSGIELSNKLLYYSSLIISDGTITLEKLSDTLKEQCMGKTISYVLLAENWDNGVQEIDLDEYYNITENTRVDIDFGQETNEQLMQDDCAGIYIVNNENNDDKILAHFIGNQPTEDIAVQLTIKETY